MKTLFVYNDYIGEEEKNYIASLASSPKVITKKMTKKPGGLATNDISEIVVFGGDGAMLHAIRSFYNIGAPFFGINLGHRGFLLNNFLPKTFDELKEQISDSIEENLWTLEAEIETAKGKKRRIMSFNDIWVRTKSGQTIKMKIRIGKREISDIIVGDGVILSTPQGTTGYARAAGGIIVKPSMDIVQLTPLACVFDTTGERLAPILEKNHTPITIELPKEINIKRDYGVFFDGIECKEANDIQLKITVRKAAFSIKLKFIKGISFYDKIYGLEGYKI